MAVLITNLGNSDISAPIQGGEDLIFRKDRCFRDLCKELVEKIKSRDVRCSSDFHFYFDPTISIHDRNIDHIAFPILGGFAQELDFRSIKECYLIVTNQDGKKSSGQDTIFLFDIVEHLLKEAFPGIRIFPLEITCNPSDFDSVLEEMDKVFPASINDPEKYVLLSSGTPAMVFALAEISLKNIPDARQLYLQRPGGREKGCVKEITTFYKKQKQSELKRFTTLVEKANYAGAQELIEITYLKSIPGLRILLNSLKKRKNYDFPGSKKDFEKLKVKNPTLYKITEPYFQFINHFQECFFHINIGDKKEERPDYLSQSFAYIFWENVFHIEHLFSTNQLLMALGIFSTLIDILNYFIISRSIGENLIFMSNTKKIPVLTDFVSQNPELSRVDDIKKNLLDTGKRKVLNNTAPVLLSVIKWLAKKHPESPASKYLDFYRGYNVEGLRGLRNHSPIGHSIKGFEKQIIIREMGGHTVGDLIKELKQLAIQYSVEEPPNYFEVWKPLSQYLEGLL